MINRDSITASMVTSVIAIAIAAIVLAGSAWSAISAIFIGANGAQEPSDRIAQLVQEHRDDIELYRARIDGRSAFFRPPPRRSSPPPPPPPPPSDDVEEVEEEVEPPPPPPPPPPPVPNDYNGPPVLYVLGDMVVFRSSSPGEAGLRIRVGQKRNGIDVVAVMPPRSVRLGYQPDGFERAEFDVPIFDWVMPGLAQEHTASDSDIQGLIMVDGSTEIRLEELYERMAGGVDPTKIDPSRGATSRTVPSRSTASPPRGRATPPSRGRGR
jgi:hypothetical protein